MEQRTAAIQLAARHRLDAAATQALLALAGLAQEPPALLPRLWRGTAVVAAVLGGLGVVFWVAANWAGWGRPARFALLQGLVAATLLGAWARPALARPLGLLALLGIGALLAYFGQTYQTGADPWQLFACWALLALPLCLAVRGDLAWSAWVLVTLAAIALWARTHTGHAWRAQPQDLPVHLAAWGAAVLVTVVCAPAWSQRTGAGLWSWRGAVALAVALVVLAALGALFSRTAAWQYGAGLLVLAAAASWFGVRRGFDLFALSTVAAGLDLLLLAGLCRWLFGQADEWIGALLLVGLACALLLAASVHLILRLAHRAQRLEPPA